MQSNKIKSPIHWRALTILAKALAVVMVLIIVAWWGLGRYQEAQLKALKAELKAEGIPLSSAERWPMGLPDSENTAVLYQQAFELLGVKTPGPQVVGQTSDGRITDYFDFDAPGNPPLADVQPTLDIMLKARQYQEAQYSRDSDNWSYAQLPYGDPTRFYKIRLLVDYCAQKALALTESGDVAHAWDYIVAGFHAANSLRDEPSLVAATLRTAAATKMVEKAEALVNAAPLPTTLPEGIYKELNQLGDRQYTQRVIQWEMVSSSSYIQTANAGRSLRATLTRPLTIHFQISILTTMRELRDMASRPTYENTDRIDVILKKSDAPLLLSPGAVGAPTFVHKLSSFDELITRCDLMALALALRQHHAAHGAYPDDLQGLVPTYIPQLPIDPFSGQDYIYKPSANGFILYGTGYNGEDDGGDATGSIDQVWTVGD